MVFEKYPHMNSDNNFNQGFQQHQSFSGSSYYLPTSGDLLSSNSELNVKFQEHERCNKNLLSGLLADRPRSGPPLQSNFSIHKNHISGTISQELFEKLQSSSESVENVDFVAPDDFKIPSENCLESKPEEAEKLVSARDAISLSSPPKPSWMDTIKAYADLIHPIDCVIALEECRPLSGKTSFMTALRNSYLQPLLKELNGGPEINVEFGCDVYTSLYSLVTFDRKSSDVTHQIIPNSTSDLPGTPLVYRIYKKLDELQHEDLFSPKESVDILSVLEKILDRFKAFDDYRKGHVTSHRYLIIVTISDFSGLDATRLAKLSEEYRSRGIQTSIFSPRSCGTFEQIINMVNLQSNTSLTGPPVWATSLITGQIFASTCHFIQRESITLDSSDEFSELPVTTSGSFPSINKDTPGYENSLKRTHSATDTGALSNNQPGHQPASNCNSVMEQAPSSVMSDNVHTPQSFIAASPSITQPNTPHTETSHTQILQHQLLSNESPTSHPQMPLVNSNSCGVPPSRNPTPHMKSAPFHSTTPSPTPTQAQQTAYPVMHSGANFSVQRPIAPATPNIHQQRRPPHFNSPTPMHQNPNLPPVSMMNQQQMMEKQLPVSSYGGMQQMMDSPQPEFIIFEGQLHMKQHPNSFQIQIISPLDIPRLTDWNGQAQLNISMNKNQLISNVANNSIPIRIRKSPNTHNALMQLFDNNTIMIMMPVNFNPNPPPNSVNFICLYKNHDISGFVPRDQIYLFNELKRSRGPVQQQSHSMPQSNFNSMTPQHSQMVQQQQMPPQYNQYSQRNIPMTAQQQQVYSTVSTGGGGAVMSNMPHPNYMPAPPSTTPDHMISSYNKGPLPSHRMIQPQQANRMRHHEQTSHHAGQMQYQHQHAMGYPMSTVNSQMSNPNVMHLPHGSNIDIDYPVKFDNKTGMPYP